MLTVALCAVSCRTTRTTADATIASRTHSLTATDRATHTRQSDRTSTLTTVDTDQTIIRLSPPDSAGMQYPCEIVVIGQRASTSRSNNITASLSDTTHTHATTNASTDLTAATTGKTAVREPATFPLLLVLIALGIIIWLISWLRYRH